MRGAKKSAEAPAPSHPPTSPYPANQPTHTAALHHPQAVRDAKEVAEAQAAWLREALPRQFTEKLLKQVMQRCVLGGVY